MMEFQEGSYWIARKTLPQFVNNVKSGKSKNAEWMMVEGVPCIVTSTTDDTITLNSFTSSSDRTFTVKKEEMTTLFTKATIENECIVAPKYPVVIPKTEFAERTRVKELENRIKSLTKSASCDVKLRKILDDKLSQLVSSQGASGTLKISEYEKFHNGGLEEGHKQKRIGSPLFNRNLRWCPPIEITYEEFEKSASYPAPLGIRAKDFCLPSELYATIIELLTQIYNMKNIDKEIFTIELEKRSDHICKYCGECLDADEYTSAYKSVTNYMEICHRDPNDRFLPRNMYWGHGECNRRQGGYSEGQRQKDGFLLALKNGLPDDVDKLTEEEKNVLSGLLNRMEIAGY